MQSFRENFDSVWDLAYGRLKQAKSNIIKFFSENHENLGLQAVRRFLSIGPGNGEMDCTILSFLPNITTYTAVDTCAKLLTDLSTNVNKLGKIKTEIVHGSLEDYEGPSVPMDFLFMSHVLYHVYDTLPSQIQRTLQWLRVGGTAVIVINTGATEDHLTCHSELYNALSGGIHSDCSSTDVKKALNDQGIIFKETCLPLPMLIQKGPGLEELLQMLAMRKLELNEMEILLKIMRKYCEPGSDVCMTEQSIFIIKKE